MSRSMRSARGISTRSVEVAVAIAVFILGALVVFESLRLGAKWADDGPEAGYFPFYVGSILCICAAVLLVLASVGRQAGPPVFVTWAALRRVLNVVGPALLYVIGIQFLGIYVASAAYIAGFMLWLGRYTAPLSVTIGVTVMGAFFLMFEVWFKVPLYKGMLDPLAFLGY